MAMGWFLFFLYNFKPSVEQFEQYQLVYRALSNEVFSTILLAIPFVIFVVGTVLFEETWLEKESKKNTP